MYCSQCGASIAETAAFCAQCGRPTGAAAPQTPPAIPSGAILTAPPPVAAAVPGVAYAGFWLRFVALIIDGVVLGIVMTPLFFIGMLGMMGKPVPSDPFEMLRTFMPRFLLMRFVGLASGWIYFALMESSSWQATLGKKTLGLYVTDMEGRRIGFGRATGRFLGKIISNFTLLIGYIMAGFTARKQALHDIMAGCLVLRKL